jgi:hypothetical protein
MVKQFEITTGFRATALRLALLGVCATAWTQNAAALGTSGNSNPFDTLAVSAVPPVEEKTSDPTKPENPVDSAAKPVAANPLQSPRSSFRFGMTYYYGISNAGGAWGPNTDGGWAGFGPSVPSNINGTWQMGDNRLFRLSVGVGALSNSKPYLMDRVPEAYYQIPLRKGDSLQVGKFLVPFASMEWMLSSKYGVQYTGSRGPVNFAASLQYCRELQSTNLYLKVGKQVGKRTTLNLSGALGRGVNYATSHNAMLGVDLAHDFGGATLTSEYALGTGAGGPFQFLYGKLAFNKLGSWTPYVGAYYWHDASGQMGRYSSALAGLSFRANSLVTFDVGFARREDRNVLFFESRTSF